MSPELLRQYAQVMRDEGLTQLVLKDDQQGEISIVMPPRAPTRKPPTREEQQREEDRLLFASSEGFPGETELGSHG
jgi:hypothetical protein